MHKKNGKNSGKLIRITIGTYKDETGKIYNHESPVNGKLLVHLDNGTNIIIESYKCQIYGYFDKR
jgi:hypothetical protein